MDATDSEPDRLLPAQLAPIKRMRSGAKRAASG
jgi:hypothetical protein